MNLANTFKSVKKLNNITDKTVSKYIGYLEGAYLIEKSQRYDIKGKKYIGLSDKYYFKDMGLRNAILSFRQTEENHLMENIIFNEMRHRGFLIDVGNVEIRVVNSEGKRERVTLEVDFVCNLGAKRYYLQCTGIPVYRVAPAKPLLLRPSERINSPPTQVFLACFTVPIGKLVYGSY